MFKKILHIKMYIVCQLETVYDFTILNFILGIQTSNVVTMTTFGLQFANSQQTQQLCNGEHNECLLT